MVLKLGKGKDDSEQAAFIDSEDPEYSRMINDIENDDDVKGGFKNLNMMFKMETEGNPLKDRKDTKGKKDAKGKTETTIVDGKEYSKMANDEESESDDDDDDDREEYEVEFVEEDAEEEEEEVKEKVEIPDQGCCACDPQSRNMTLGSCFSIMCANIVILLQFVANIDDWQFSPTSDFTKGYLRLCMAICTLIRAVHMMTLLNLAATVKRNAIYVYPTIYKHGKFLMNISLLIHGMDFLALYYGGDGLNTWAEITITSTTTIATLHSGLLVWFLISNGSMSVCCHRRVLGEEAETYVIGSGRMKISESNKGVVDPNVHVDLDVYSIV